MKCTIPEISWHNREPVLSVDIHPTTDKFYRLATGGADCHVLIWQMNICENGAVKFEPLSDLTRHQRAVNVVRFSPNGQYLATADDDANIITWQLKTDNIPLLEGETNDKETWIVFKIIRGHKEDIYDLCWSPNSLKLVSGSVDNTAILWNVLTGKCENILSNHKGFVQGVSWDPKGLYVASISTDRVCRIFNNNGKQVVAKIQKGNLPVPNTHYLHNKEVKYFHDDTFKSFFRRLDFSPDGSLLAVPSGRVEDDDNDKILNATYLFVVDSWAQPAAVLPTGTQCSTVVRFCPLLFELQDDGPEATVSLPYRMILAIGLDHDVLLFDTQQTAPFAYFHNIHYTRLTDLTWSKDGLLLIASSTDGFCALITFELNELGVPYTKEESEAEENPLDVSGCTLLETEETSESSKEILKNEVVQVSKPKKPNLLEKWAIKTPKKKSNDENETVVVKEVSKTEEKKEMVDLTNTELSKKTILSEPVVNKVIKKRVQLITIKDTDSVNSVGSKKDNVVAQPIAVRRQPKEASTLVKTSPLLNFLKLTPRSKSNNERRSASVVSSESSVVVDDLEARDSWNCETKEKVKEEGKNEDESMNECTTDINFHLDDDTTTNQSRCTTNDDNRVISKEVKETETTVIAPEKNIKNDGQLEKNKTLAVKRRVSLITLSSPKQKKK